MHLPLAAAALAVLSLAVPAGATTSAATPAPSGELCTGFGPQAPRDIRNVSGSNPVTFAKAPPATQMNLCNIHTHTNAEHAGPGFAISHWPGDTSGYRCNETLDLTEAEAEMPHGGHDAYHGVVPGDTIEVHWVYSSCPVAPGEGLGACLSETCANPELRVESQVFLVVNNPQALDFRDFDYAGAAAAGRHQPRALPSGTGTPVEFLGSTTGTSYNASSCSPMQVTWSVRPNCAKLDIASLHAWAAEGNVFNETHSHGVRDLVTAEALLSPIR